MSTWFITGCSTAFLLLGADALGTYRQVTEAQLAEVRAWEKVSASTGFAD